VLDFFRVVPRHRAISTFTTELKSYVGPLMTAVLTVDDEARLIDLKNRILIYLFLPSVAYDPEG